MLGGGWFGGQESDSLSPVLALATVASPDNLSENQTSDRFKDSCKLQADDIGVQINLHKHDSVYGSLASSCIFTYYRHGNTRENGGKKQERERT